MLALIVTLSAKISLMLGGIRLVFAVRVTIIDLMLHSRLVLYIYHSQKNL